MTSSARPRRGRTRVRSALVILSGGVLTAAALITASTGQSLLLAAGLIAGAVAVFTLAPSIIGRPSGAARKRLSATPAQLKHWRTAHPGSSITDAVDAHTQG